MKSVFVFITCALLGNAGYSQELKTPAASTGQTIKQEFGLSTVEVSYSRPNVKNREIFGGLVPYGKVWRTGANAATTISFADEVTIGTTKVPAGKYGLLTIPGADEWTFIISKQTDVNNPANYKESEDVVRVKAKPHQLSYPIESFQIMFDKVMPESMLMVLLWDKTAVALPIASHIDAKVMADIDKAMGGSKPPYMAAAIYYIDNGKDLNKAIQWIDKGIAENPKAYWAYYQKARALAQTGKKADAVATARKAIDLAKEANNADYVTLNEKLIASIK